MLIPGNAGFTGDEILKPAELAARIAARADPVAEYVWNHMTDEEKALATAPSTASEAFRGALNRLVAGPPLAAESAFSTVKTAGKTRWLAELSPASAFANRFLLLDAFPGLLRSSQRTIYDASFSPDGGRIVTADF